MPSYDSPNILNYRVGKGVPSWQPIGTTGFNDLGNSARIEFTPRATPLAHWSHRKGTRFKDDAIVVTKEGELLLTLDEWSYLNLELALLGSRSGNTVNILDLSNLKGTLQFVDAQDVGPRKIWTFPTVILFPNAKLDLISNEYGEIELQGQVMGDPTTGSFGTVADE